MRKRQTQPQKQQAPQAQIIHESTTATYYRGQLPPPEMIEHYNRIMPNFGERLLTMVENREIHQIKKETKIINVSKFIALTGLTFGFVFSISVLVFCYFGFKMGHPVSSATIASAVIGVTGVLVFKQGGRAEKREKAK